MVHLGTTPREFHRGRHCVLSRSRLDDGRPVILKTVRHEPATDRVDAAVLRHEYEILNELHVPGVVQALALEVVEGAPMLVLEDAGETNLADWRKGRALDEQTFFELAIPIARTLADLHQRAVLHRDLSPTNIVLDDSLRPTLIDFETATHVTAVPSATNGEELQGTLTYMAPEQTGRMQRPVDHRTDLYALGAIYYEMLTATPPLVADDPVALMHAILAWSPVPPDRVRPGLPALLSDLLLRLLAKMPEQRYQSAEALVADLETAHRHWSRTSSIPRFELGSRDRRDLVFPEGLVGRDAEERELLARFERVQEGAREVAFVVGPSGFGKTALVAELRRRIEARCWFCTGKAEPFEGATPYAVLGAAMGQLAQHFARMPEAALRPLRQRVIEAVGSTGRMLIDLAPELESVLGAQPKLPTLGPGETATRLHLTLLAFLRACSTRNHPLVLFLDDLQWADPGSLKLLGVIATAPDLQHLLLIGAYRPEPAPADLATTLETLHEAQMPFGRIELGALDHAAITAWLSRILACSPARASPLARAVLRKTGGEPLFVTRLLQLLHRAHLLVWDARSSGFRWDLSRIEEMGRGEDVIALMLAALQELPSACRAALAEASCIGSQFDLWLLAKIRGEHVEETARTLAPALQEGLIAVAHLRYRADSETPDPSPGFHTAYRFVHDRILQAAHALIADEQATRVHLEVALHLSATAKDDELDRRLFDIVGQFRRGQAEITAPSERLRLCSLFHRAGRKALRSAAYDLALGYLESGLALLPSDAFQTQPSLARDLHADAVLCAYMADRRALAESLLSAALAHLGPGCERAQLHEAALIASTAKADYGPAMDHGRRALAEIGVELPSSAAALAALPAELQAADEGCKARGLQSLLGAPVMQDRHARDSARLLAQLSPAAFLTDRPLIGWITMRLVNLTLRYGNAPESGMAFAVYGIIRAEMGELMLGRALGELAVALSRRFGEPFFESRALMALGLSLNHWGAPLRTSLPILQESMAKALEAGDVEEAAGSKSAQGFMLLAVGQSLPRTLAHVEAALAEGSGHRIVESVLLLCRQVIRCLQGRTHGPTRLDGPDCDCDALDAAVATAPVNRALCEVARLQIAFVARDFELAGRCVESASAHLGFMSTFFQVAEYNWYSSLTWATRADLVKSEAPALLERIAENQRRLAAWADNSPENFRHKHALVAAEVARLRGETLPALELYDEAIEGAARAGFVQDQALASELAGRCRLALGKHNVALSYLASAKAGYQRWGATAKVRALSEELPGLEQEQAFRRSPRTDELGSSALDLRSVMKASETISRELGLEPLIARLMEVCLEVAGAERGALVLEQDGEPMVRAVATSGEAVQLEGRPVVASGLVPVSVIQETRRTAEALVLADATQDARFAADPYITQRQVRSVLAVPMLRQTTAIGVLYLENNLATHAFGASRVRILQTLSSQLAVSLAHSRLFEKLTREVDERRRAQATLVFLAESSAALGESLDYRATLAKTAQIAVPFLADVCVVDMVVDEGDRIERVAVAHVDPTKEQSLRELLAYPPRWEAPDATTRILQSGEPLVVPELTDRALELHFPGAPQAALQRARELGTRTLMSVPLRVRGRVVGVLHLGSAAAGRRYGPADLSVAQEYARRMGLAIENARLYAQSQQSIHVRDEFLSVASHELRTPLQALQLSVEGVTRLMARAGYNGEIGRRIAMIDRQTGRIARLVEMLLDVSRIHAGRLDIEIEHVDLSALVREVAARFAAELTRANCALTLKVQPDVAGAWDRLRLDQVITNLLSNAIKFGPGQPIEIGLEDTGASARLWVTDHGIGIPPERQRHIFERFERAVPTRSYGGLGLGLYISRTIVEALGGTIRVASEPGKGSSFTVELAKERPP